MIDQMRLAMLQLDAKKAVQDVLNAFINEFMGVGVQNTVRIAEEGVDMEEDDYGDL